MHSSALVKVSRYAHDVTIATNINRIVCVYQFPNNYRIHFPSFPIRLRVHNQYPQLFLVY